MDADHLRDLLRSADSWNSWRSANPANEVDLSDIDLSERDLRGIDFSRMKMPGARFVESDLRGANFESAVLRNAIFYQASLAGAKFLDAGLAGANFEDANLEGCDLRSAELVNAEMSGSRLTGARMFGADLEKADLSHAKLPGADLTSARLIGTDCTGADLSGANLQFSVLVNTNFSTSNLDKAMVFGIAAWGLDLEGASQNDLVVNADGESAITVDNVALAQLIHIIIKNSNMRYVIEEVTSKMVLILGRFSEERKQILDAIRDRLRQHGYVPILFDFDKPTSKGLIETILTISSMSRFVIADVSDPRSVPHELAVIVPPQPSLPVQPIKIRGEKVYATLPDLYEYPWFLPLFEYDGLSHLMASMETHVIGPPEARRLSRATRSLST